MMEGLLGLIRKRCRADLESSDDDISENGGEDRVYYKEYQGIDKGFRGLFGIPSMSMGA